MRKNLLLAVLFLFATVAAFAQITTSSMTGTVKDSKEALIGATVKAVHVPSGTVYSTATRADGRFNIPNMRAGGPYTIEVTYLGYEPQRFTDVTLKLAEPFVLNIALSQTGTTLNAVNIVATNPRSVLNSDRSGSTTNISRRDVLNLPSIRRNINDLVRTTPQASSDGQSIGGGNYRQNNITVDGGNFNNQFGIGTNLPGNGSPIPLDALDEITVNLNPTDVRQSGFIGSAINATTRSGTNEFSGSAYTYFRTQKQQGTKVKYFPELVPADLNVKIYGARVGGPIIKNKLFFFANVERAEEPGINSRFRASSAAEPFPATPNVNRPTVTEMDAIKNYLVNTYGYDPGVYQNYGYKSTRTNIVGRLDWNINDKNRFNVRYSRLESQVPSFISTSTNPLTSSVVYPNGGNRSDNNSLTFSNSNYYTNYNFYSLSAELNSTFWSSFANTLRFTYNNQNEPRSYTGGTAFPTVDILKDGRPFTAFGSEPFTGGNLRDVNSYSFVDYVQASFGKHNVLGGIQADFATTKNGFQRFANGYYVFNSFADFTSGALPRAYARTFSLNPDYSQAFPTFKNQTYSIYAQDDYNATDKLRLSYGVRANLYTYSQDALTHPLVASMTFANGEKLNTGSLPKSAFLVSPRVGFNYDIKGDRSLQLRGSAGIYSGGIPNVWIVSQVGDAGMIQFTQTATTPTDVAAIAGPFSPDPRAYLPATPPVAGTTVPSALSFIDPKIKSPQSFKSNLALDAKLPFGFTGTLEGIYNRDFRTVIYRNPNLVEGTPLNIAGYPDNRLIYPVSRTQRYINTVTAGGIPVPNTASNASDFNTYVLDNGTKGYYYSIAASLQKQFSKGFSASLSYVYSKAKNQFDGNGDQPSGAWQNTYTVNGSNYPEMGYAGYVLPNRIVANLTYRKEYLKHLASQISIFYNGSNQGRVSYVYSTDFNRDGGNSDLIYVPANPSEITFVPWTIGSGANAITYTAQQQSDIFFRFIEQDNYLSSRKGKYAERNGGLSPWFNQVDLQFQQDLFQNIGGKRNTLQFNLTIQNFANFLNKNWGVRQVITQNAILVPMNNTSVVAGGATRPTFRLQFDGNLPTNAVRTRDDVSFNSTYLMQFGLRYIFN